MRGIMRRGFGILVLISVLWCALHLAEPAGAAAAVFHDEHSAGELSHPGSEAPNSESGDPADFGHAACHHHCPIAPDQRVRGLDDGMAPGAGPLLGAPVAVLHSQSPPPLLKPPAA